MSQCSHHMEVTTMLLTTSSLVHNMRINWFFHYIKIWAIFLLCKFSIFFPSESNCHHNITKEKKSNTAKEDNSCCKYYYQNLICPIVAQGTILGPMSTGYICIQIRERYFLFLLILSQIRYSFIKQHSCQQAIISKRNNVHLVTMILL
jgi:hypothetical protein